VSDPTFGNLREYLRTKLRWSHRTHYLLARRRDVDALREMISHDPIRVIVFGDEHEELEPYLRDQLLPNVPI
jgi:hypothetical protein